MGWESGSGTERCGLVGQAQHFFPRHPPGHSHLLTISHDNLVRAQRGDQAIRKIIELKDSDTRLADEMCKTVSGATRKLLKEGRLHCSWILPNPVLSPEGSGAKERQDTDENFPVPSRLEEEYENHEYVDFPIHIHLHTL